MKSLPFAFFSALLLISCGAPQNETAYNPEADTLKYENEVHFRNLRQLTFGADNAEAYWSFDDKELVFQSNNPEWTNGCDQIFYMDATTDHAPDFKPPIVSTNLGRTTCAFFLPDETIIYASTHLAGPDCPEEPERTSDAYVWPIYDSYDIFRATKDGEIIDTLTTEPGYNAEATVSPLGDKIVFTSMRTGNLELYTMNIDGSDVTQVTDHMGYNGGAFFSPDGKQLLFRASRPQTEEEINKYTGLLGRGLVEPTHMEIFVVNVDGTGMKQITDLGGANWAPYFHPSGEKIVFSSNHHTEHGFPFNLFMINVDGTGLEQITFDDTFDSFPMFSHDGTKIVFSSNRHNGGTRDTNVFVAEWVD